LQFVGTATMVLRLGTFSLLTDPNFLHRGQRAYLGYGLTSVRRTEPALQIDELPPLDAIVLSHLHGDHWDRVARRGLDHRLPVLTTPKAARALRRQGFAAAEGLDTWSSTTLSRDGETVTITAVPGRHGTGMARLLLPPVMGSMLEYRLSAGGPACGSTSPATRCSSTICARYRSGTGHPMSRSCTSVALHCPGGCWSRWMPGRAPTCSSCCARRERYRPQ
jgi:hypothetical protein